MNAPLISTVLAAIEHHKLLESGSKIILGLSGGPDSVFLLHVLAPLQVTGHISLIAAHLDHEWRPESYQDMIFCRELTQQLQVPFIATKMSDLGMSMKVNGSKEEQGRSARRAFFQKLLREHGAHRVALAHHADDQQELFFIRIARGASLAGLAGMKWSQGVYIRPLLGVTKSAILSYLAEHAIPYRTDPSNQSPAFLRNRIRHTALPALQACDARFTQNFLRTFAQLQQADTFLNSMAEHLFEQLATVDGGQRGIDWEQFLELHPIMQHRIFVMLLCFHGVPFTPSTALFDESVRFMRTARSSSHQIHPSWRLVKRSRGLFVECGI